MPRRIRVRVPAGTTSAWSPSARPVYFGLASQAPYEAASSEQRKPTFDSESVSLNCAVLLVVELSIPEMTGAGGGVVSMTHVRVAGELSDLPFTVAVTANVCVPCERPVYETPDVQAVAAAPSREHLNVAPLAPVKLNCAVVRHIPSWKMYWKKRRST